MPAADERATPPLPPGPALAEGRADPSVPVRQSLSEVLFTQEGAVSTSDSSPWGDPLFASHSLSPALVSAVGAAVAKPVESLVLEAIGERFEELTSRLLQAVCEAEAKRAEVLPLELSARLMERLAPQLASELSDHLTRSVNRTLEQSPEATSVCRRLSSDTESSLCVVAAPSVKRQTSHQPSNGTWRSGPEADRRDVKALEDKLADQLLEESGIAPTQVRRRRKCNQTTTRSMVSVLPPGARQVSLGSGQSSCSSSCIVGQPPAQRCSKEDSSSCIVVSPAPPLAPCLLSGSPCAVSPPPLPTMPAHRSAVSGQASTPAPESPRGSDRGAEPQRDPGQPPGLAGAALPNAVEGPAGGLPEAGDREAQSAKSERGSCASVAFSRVVAVRHPTTTDEMLQDRIKELTGEIPNRSAGEDSGSDEDTAPAPKRPPCLLALCGLVPWAGVWGPRLCTCYQGLVGLLTIAAAVGALIELASTRHGFWSIHASCAHPDPVCWRQRGLLSDMPVAVGSVIGFLLLRPWEGNKGLLESIRLIQSYAHHKGLTQLLQRRMRRELWWALAVWLCAVCAAGVGLARDSFGDPPSAPAALSFAMFSFLAGIFMCLCFGQLYVCRALMNFVDTFCCGMVDSPLLSDTTHQWNVLQAVLRKASGSIEHCFVVIQGVSAFAVPLLMADLFVLGPTRKSIPTLIPGATLTLGVLRLFFLAAAVTDKCSRVPSLLNSLHFGPGTERERQHIVEYVANSAAGFYVANVRLTSTIALKFLYMWTVVAFGLCTQLLSE